ncbi:FAD-dependent oxidoreductase [Deinococcus peraridilitoris]|uniref:NAD/FAD-utilizing enzyme apparently involved in cell division n=1 Tax=Deinococcus peraridilitoris (strain DSM 19664 / LMG 22246 / CIP 109416 / KR-200) TaxID=937777 RepID=L0A360_DEIPD|nr:FAD-dependent oxidoreductase [Deinococcus peraridilitoris]AFZ67884.1 NAD/FAD-utilizing enzyme apparently involved in cell division [Deinococcus peraridilitoris DSM 19664]
MFRSVTPRSLPQPGHLYDVAIVGAGLAGSELAWRLAGAGQDVLLVSQALDNVGNLYHQEVDFGFPPGSLFEEARERALPERTNWALHRQVKFLLEMTPGVHLLQSCVSALEVQPEAPYQLRTWEGPLLSARRVVLAVGSFLRGRLLIGHVEEEAGRLSEVAYDFLAHNLADQGLQFAERQDEAPGESGGMPYQVRYLTLSAGELQDFRVTRWPEVYALGRCVPGELDYAATLQAAARLASHLTAQLPVSPPASPNEEHSA